MKHIILFIAFLFAYVQLNAQSTSYDSVLAKKLNADVYGMKNYYLVILKTGTANITDKIKLDSIFAGHFKNIQRLAAKNKLVVAGPIGKNDKTYRGIFILNTANKDEAEKWVATDPAVQAKVLDAEYYAWYGSAALEEINNLHIKIQKDHF